MSPIVRAMANFTLRYRFAVLIAVVTLTAFFCYGAFRVQTYTKFNDLLPMSHPYIKTHMDYINQLGDPLKVFVMLRVKEGDIYNSNTLNKITEIQHAVDVIPGVNHTQVISLASSKLRYVVTTEDEIRSQTLMPKVPETDTEMKKLKERVRKSEGIFGLYVSFDEKSLLLTANFFSRAIDYKTTFDKINEIIKRETDANHEIMACGEPILTGWVYKYQNQMYLIFGLTAFAMLLLLFAYFRNFAGVVVPLLSAILSAVWGLGFTGFLGYNLDPLTLVVPVLITARALSHSVQMVERYFELVDTSKDTIKAAVDTICSIFPPGTLSIVTDAMGILFIAIAPIPLVQKISYVCAFWATSIIVNGLIFTPLALSFFTPPKNIPTIIDVGKGWVQTILSKIVGIGYGKSAYYSFFIILAITVLTGYQALRVHIGDVNPGSPILWPDSEYNQAVHALNKDFPGVEELYVIVEGKYSNTIKKPEVLRLIDRFQRYMEEDQIVHATSSIADLIPPFYKALNLGHAKWELLPDTPGLTGQLMYYLTAGSHPGDYDRYMSRDFKAANIIVWYADHMGSTIKRAIERAKSFIDKAGNSVKGIKFRLASGNIGILAAVNESVEESQLLNFILIMGSSFLLCAITYRSFVAALILLFPLNVTNLITLSIMYNMNIGLNINTLPIVSLGVGIGIDYGIYLLSRICEEYQTHRDYYQAFLWAIKTSGKAIFFTATTMAAGTIFWYFLSDLRFQAEMGLLLTIVMVINMIMALILIPAVVYIFKPKFVGEMRVLLSERAS